MAIMLYLGKPVSASSVYVGDKNWELEYLTDGVVQDGRGAHTLAIDTPWLRVNLAALYDVIAIKIWNRPSTMLGE